MKKKKIKWKNRRHLALCIQKKVCKREATVGNYIYKNKHLRIMEEIRILESSLVVAS